MSGTELIELSYADRRRQAWVQTWTGRRVFPLDPTPDQFNHADIAKALSLICRFTGHLAGHYSVAQHCVIAARVAEARGFDPRPVLLHDAAEAYLGDFPAPIKPFVPGLDVIEARLLASIGEWAGVSLDPLPDYVHVIDREMLQAERYSLKMQDHGQNRWNVPARPNGIEIKPFKKAFDAECAFLWAFRRMFPGVQ